MMQEKGLTKLDLSKNTIDYYNQNADAFIQNTIHADMKEHYDRFVPYLPEQASILDLGCGSGRDSQFFMKQGYFVTLVDGSIEVCKQTSKLLGVEVRCLLFEDLDYHNKFDGVWACASLLHVNKSDMPRVLQKVSAALKQTGVLYASFKYGDAEEIKGSRFYNYYSENTINELFQSSDFVCKEYWISCDVRPEHRKEKWLNLIAIKTPIHNEKFED